MEIIFHVPVLIFEVNITPAKKPSIANDVRGERDCGSYGGEIQLQRVEVNFH